PLKAGQLRQDALLLPAPTNFTFGMNDAPGAPGGLGHGSGILALENRRVQSNNLPGGAGTGEFKNRRKSRSRRGDEAEMFFAPKSASSRRRLPFLNTSSVGGLRFRYWQPWSGRR